MATGTALAHCETTRHPVAESGAPLSFGELERFRTVPQGRDFDVATVMGLVVVFDRKPIFSEGIVEGRLYVRENQRSPGGAPWDAWLKLELERSEGGRPSSQLITSREVVQAVVHPAGGPAFRLANRFVDGPYREWAYGLDVIGKVIGLYEPGRVR